jgi:serine/threonine protein phosphatase PrpC
MGFQRAWPRRRADRPAPAEPVPTPTAVPEAPEAAEPAGLPKPPAAPSPPIAGEPADLPSGAPSIGRVGGVQLGHVKPGTTLRPAAIALDGTAAGVFQVAAASMIGAGHLQSGQPRQDAYNFMVGRSGRLYVAIADGLGSKPVSQLGAHLFTESVLVVAAHAETDGDAEPDPARLLVQASGRMADVIGDAYGLDPKTAGCVGAVAIFSDRGCAIARIGDVSAFTISGGTFTEAFPSDGGPLNIVSASMPDEDEQDLECVRLDPAAVVVFGTDGLANDIRNSGTLREWLAGQWRVPHLPFAIGDTLRYRRQGSHDDRTAVLVWRDDVEDGTGAVGHDPE